MSGKHRGQGWLFNKLLGWLSHEPARPWRAQPMILDEKRNIIERFQPMFFVTEEDAYLFAAEWMMNNRWTDASSERVPKVEVEFAPGDTRSSQPPRSA